MKKNNKLVKVLLASSLLLPGIAPLASQTINAAPATSVQAENVEYRVMTEEVVRFRTEENAKPVALVSAGDKVEFVREVNKKWFEVKVNGETGFILRGNLTSEENYNDDSKEIHDVKVKQEASAEKTYTVAVTTALRTADEERYRPLEILDRETSVEYLGTTVENNWFKVKAGNTTGYVKREDVTKNSNIENGQEADLSYSTFVEEADPALNVLKATLTTALRTRPGTQYSVIDEVKRDAQVTYLGTVKGLDNWFLVEADGVKGYVDRGHVTKVDEVVEEDLAVESVSAINATDLKVTLSDGSVHDVTLDEKLVQNVETEVEFTIDGNDYTETVTWVISSDIVEEELEAAKADLQAKEDALEEAAKDVFEARQELQHANKFGTEAEQKAARRALEDAKEVRNDAEVERDTAWTKVKALELELLRAEKYEAAEEALVKAEKSNKQADQKAAWTLIAGLQEGDPKEALFERARNVQKVIDAIVEAEAALDNVPAVKNVNLSYRQAVKNARAAVDAVLKLDPNAQIDEVKMEKLVGAEEKIAKIDAEIEAAKPVVKMISEIPSDDNFEDEEKSEEAKLAVVEAREAYDALDEDVQKRVSNLNRLEAKENLVNKLEAEAVSDMINKKLSHRDTKYEDLKLKDLENIVKAREAYDALNDEAKKLVTENTLAKLVELEATVAAGK